MEDDIFAALNPAQMEAVTATEGYVRVIAGAGSGKTRALSARFAYLVNELGILPSSILCVTFTNKSANEMRQRIHGLIGDNDTGFINTFHGFCNTVLLEESHAIHFPKSFMVLDNEDIDAFLKEIYEERGLSLKDMTFSKARDMIEIKKLKEEVDYHTWLTRMSLQEIHDKYLRSRQSDDIIFYGYLYHQKKNFGLDYNDLIILTLQIFEENEQIARKWQERLEYIMIDEFQDIDALQYKLMGVLSAHHKNLFVVGDPDQTIYTWRGASVKYLLDFDKDFAGTQTIMMNVNYRSTPQILQAANTLIAVNQHRIAKELTAVQPDGPIVRALHNTNTRKEAEAIVQIIKHLRRKGYAYKDIAILYRAHYMSRPIEDAFLASEIPYTIYSGVSFFQRMEIKDALAYLRMLVYRSDLDFARIINVPRRNFGKSRMQFLKEYAEQNQKSLYDSLKDNLDHPLIRASKAREFVDLIESFVYENKPVSQVLGEILDLSGYEKMMRLQGSQERLDNLAELKQAASEFEQSAGEDVSLEQYLNHAALFTNADLDMGSDTVKMMTVHTAKGLEFDNVILPGLNEGMFPSSKVKDLYGMEEERRLAFVAMTRARKQLFLTEAEGVMLSGGFRYPSRFVLESEPALLYDPAPRADLLEGIKTIIEKKAALRMDLAGTLFEPGDRIRHAVFGEGTIMETDQETLSYLIHFDSLNTLRKLSAKARLEKTGNSALNGKLN